MTGVSLSRFNARDSAATLDSVVAAAVGLPAISTLDWEVAGRDEAESLAAEPLCCGHFEGVPLVRLEPPLLYVPEIEINVTSSVVEQAGAG